jgi:ribokinase
MARLINLGSLCIDHVYRVPNIATKGETVASVSHQIFPGGKGLNQSLAAARAGARVVHAGCVGDDGALLCEVLAESGVNVDHIRTVAGESSGHGVIQVNDHGQNAIVIAGGTNRMLRIEDMERVMREAAEGDWLLLQNEINDLPWVLDMARHCAAKIAFNLAPVDGREAEYDLASVDLLIVNEVEAAALAAPGDKSPEAVLEQLRGRYPAMTIVLTLGAAGLLYCDAGGPVIQMDAFPAYAVDETAAGDAFIGFAIAALLDQQPLAQALLLGSAAGSLTVTRAGAAASIPHLPEVQKLLSQN